MTLRRTLLVLFASILGAAACSTGSEGEPFADANDPVLTESENGIEIVPEQIDDEQSAEIVESDRRDDPAIETDPARCRVSPLVSPIGGIELTVTNIGEVGMDIDVYRNGELLATLAPEPGGPDPNVVDDLFATADVDQIAYHSDFEAPLGSIARYTATAGGDPAAGARCGEVDLPEVWPTPVCAVQLVDGLPHLTLEDGFGLRSYLRNGEPVAISTSSGIGTTDGFDPDPPVGVPLSYSVASDNNRWPETVSECGSVTVLSAPEPQDLLDQAAERIERTLGPFWYTTIVPICPGCEPDLEMTYAFQFDGTTLGTWRNGFEADSTDEPWRIPPQDLPAHLIAQRSEGRNVEVDFIGEGSEIARWTVDGIGAQILCESVDTAPLTMRTPFCNPEFFN